MKRFSLWFASIFSVCYCLLAGSAYAVTLPFVDVSPTDDYYQDLSNLYERGIVPDSPNKKFNPDSLMNRDDFVAIVVGVSCKKCLMPSFEDVLRYTELPFVDFKRENQNFYCVSYAKEQGIIEGYITDASGKSSCQDGASYGEAPFCAYNKITRIEAAAVLLRQAGLWNNTLNTGKFDREMTLPDTPDGWYGYAQKAIKIGIITPDATGKIRPNENITKREFVRMAANIFRVNLCEIRSGDGSTGLQTTGDSTGATGSNTGTNPNVNGTNTASTGTNTTGTSNSGTGNSGTGTNATGNTGSTTGTPNTTGNTVIPPATLTSEIRILDSNKKCSLDTPVTTFPDPKDTSYAFCGRTDTPGGPFNYSWDFVCVQDGTKLTATGASLPNFDLGKDCTWLVRLTVTDTVTKAVSQSTATVEIQGDTKRPVTAFSSLSLMVYADKMTGEAPTNVQFTSSLQGGTGPYTYRWDFADGTFSTDPNPPHLFDRPGVRDVQLTVRDSKGATAVASVVLAFTETDDWDKDGVDNIDDACPMVYGAKSNQGCPVVVPYTGGTSTTTTPPTTGTATVVPPNLTLTLAGVNGQCRFDYAASRGAIFGTPTCTACPCQYTADFNAQIRSCDVIFPSIMSPNRDTIYSRGKVFEVRF